MKKSKPSPEEKKEQVPSKKHGSASGGDSSRTQKGDPSQKAKGKQEGRK
jgi:hypothetical protein